MEELMDDFLNYNKNLKDNSNISGEALKRILETAKRKKESETLALKVVEFLIDGKLREQSFVKSLQYITPGYYQDIVDERAITKICGYPLCGKKLPPMPNQQYSICTKQNKVYDILERKKFCSNICYRSSEHIKEQIDTSPLWLRTYENLIEFKILSVSEKALQGEEVIQTLEIPKGKASPSESSKFTSVSSFTELSLNGIIDEEKTQNKINKHKVKEKPKIMPPVPETEENITDENDAEINVKKLNRNKPRREYTERHSIKRKNSLKSSMKPIIENDESEKTNENLKNLEKDTGDEKCFVDNLQDVKQSNKVTQAIQNNNENCDVSPKDKFNEKNFKENIEANTNKINIEILNKIKTQVDNDTKKLYSSNKGLRPNSISKKENLNYSNDEDKLSKITEKIKNKLKISKVVLVDPLPIKVNSKLEYIEDGGISRNEDKSNLITAATDLNKNKSTLEGSKISKQLIEVFSEWITLETLVIIYGEDKIRSTLKEKNCEHYLDKIKFIDLEDNKINILKNICKMLKLQEINDENYSKENKLNPIPDFNELKKEKQNLDLKVKTFYKGKVYKTDDPNFSKPNENEINTIYSIPLLDDSSQTTLRRKILLNSLTKSIMHLCETINFILPNLTTDLSKLVKSFHLTAENIVFKPLVWRYIAVIMLKILSITDAQIGKKMEEEESLAKLNNVCGVLMLFDIT